MNIKAHIRSVLKEEMNDDDAASRSRHVRVTYEDGNTVDTPINGTKKEIEDYYVGKYFNMGSGDQDKMVRAVRVDFLG